MSYFTWENKNLMCSKECKEQCHVTCVFHQQLAVPWSVCMVDVSLQIGASVKGAGEAMTVPVV